MTELYIGLMSGTSMDGVDGVVADCSDGRARVLHHVHHAFAPALARELAHLNAPTDNELHRAALAGNALARAYAAIVSELLQGGRLESTAIAAIGAHGQTVRHRPGEFDGTGYTLQLNSPALLAELTGITVVADFRSRDVAAGGQGAPLVPAFHRALFAQPGRTVAVLNLGGIANLTVLRDGETTGFDCGPANALLDAWCLRHSGRPYDEGGRWAASGQVHEPLLRQLLDEPYFGLPPPKSTGRDLFNAPWLERRLTGFENLPAADVQATLTALTAQVCAADVRRYGSGCRELIVCGGGVYNRTLMDHLQAALPTVDVGSSDRHGLPALQVEATAFAWLAQRTLKRETGSLQSVTGARGARVLGAIYPA